MCVCVVCVPLLCVKGVETHEIMQHFQHVIQEIFNICGCFGMCVLALLRVCTRVCVCVCVRFGACYLCMGTSHFQTRDLVPYMYHVDHCHNCDLTIV